MPPSPARIAESFPAVGLGDIETVAALQDRVDTKYVLSLPGFAALAERLLGTHAVLEIDGRRAFQPSTTCETRVISNTKTRSLAGLVRCRKRSPGTNP